MRLNAAPFERGLRLILYMRFCFRRRRLNAAPFERGLRQDHSCIDGIHPSLNAAPFERGLRRSTN